MSSAVLIQQASGESRLLLELAATRHAAYCARHGLTYWRVIGDVQFTRAPGWNKILLVQQALRLGFDIVVWLDAETLILRDDEDIRTALNGGGPFGLVQHPPPGLHDPAAHWNCGVWILRNTPRLHEFFATVWNLGPLGHHPGHEQARILDLLPQFPDLVQRLDDRWNATVGITEVPHPVIKVWPGTGRSALPAMYAELKKLGAVDASITATASAFVHEDNAPARAARFIATIPSYPHSFQGRGLVICGGGLGYFTCAWVCVRQLRRLGCTLPVQLWHLGPGELDDRMRALVAPLGVECVDGLEVRRHHPVRILHGWELKAYALLHSPFREVLLLDADNVPVLNPELLFDTPEFRDTGAIFWPDYGRTQEERAAWKLFDVPFRDEPEFESGQILVNKETSWRPLSLALWYNEFSDFFYLHVHGDKDTFRFAWHRLGQKFAMPVSPIHALENTMCQHDFGGRRVFQHRNGDKWNFRRENQRIAGFLFEEECLADLAELRGLWDGQVARP